MTNKQPKQVWISPRPDGKWKVQRPGTQRPSHVTNTQGEAIERGREQAQNNGADLGRNGIIRSHDSYGNDPNPPKDTEH
jgi:hypothetical protein